MTENKFNDELGRYLLGEMQTEERKLFLETTKSSPEQFSQLQKYILLDSHLKLHFDNKDTSESKLLFFPDQLNSKLFLSAAALVFSLFGLFFFYYPKDNTEILAYSPKGECHDSHGIISNQQPNGNSISSYSNSICDLYFRGKRNLKIRLMPNSKLYYFRNDDSVALHLASGSLIAQTGNSSAAEAVFLVVKGVSFQFMGTEILANRLGGINPFVEVHSGKLQVEDSANIKILLGLKNQLQLTEKAPDFQAEKNLVLAEKKGLYINQKNIMIHPVNADRQEEIKRQFSIFNKTWSGSNKSNVQIDNMLEDEIKTYNENSRFPFSVFLKNGKIFRASFVYHKNNKVLVEKMNEHFEFDEKDILKIEQEKSETY